MRIGILGTGRMARALGGLFARSGHDVVHGSRSAVGSAAVSYAEAAAHGELVVLASSWEHVPRVLSAAGSLDGKILLDVTNPEAAEGYDLVVGFSSSGGERVAELAKGARVVKAFNHVYAEVLDRGARFGEATASVLCCGDDREAKAVVIALTHECGFHAVDAGALRNARFTEPVAALMVQLVRVEGHAPDGVALAVLSRGGA